jgi:hypothetical protein
LASNLPNLVGNKPLRVECFILSQHAGTSD